MAVTGQLSKANAAALYDMITSGSALTATTLASGDYIGIGDVSATTGKKITINNLINFFMKGDKMLDLGSYSVLLNFTSSGANLNISFNGYDVLFILGHNGQTSYRKSSAYLYEINEKKLLACGMGHSPVYYYVDNTQYSFSGSPYYRFHTVSSNFQLDESASSNIFTFNATTKKITTNNNSNNDFLIFGLKYKLLSS